MRARKKQISFEVGRKTRSVCKRVRKTLQKSFSRGPVICIRDPTYLFDIAVKNKIEF